MHVAAIISEYNPFHAGHKYHVNMTRNKGYSHIVSVMSGNFVQRGEVSIMSKWSRARSALNLGVDLVLELPTIFSMSRAEKFSFGAVKILNSLNVIEALSFGSECTDLKILENISRVLTTDEYSICLKKFLKTGITFAVSRSNALCEILKRDISNIISSPNNILAIEYMKSLIMENSKIYPIAIERIGPGHDVFGLKDGLLSASHIRKLIRRGESLQCENVFRSIPEPSLVELICETDSGRAPADMIIGERAIISKLRTMSRNDIKNVSDVSEGIENRIFEGVRNTSSLNELYNYVKTKRYTQSRIRRIIFSAFLGITKNEDFINPKFVNVLGFNDKGRDILRMIKNKSKFPIITRYSDIKKLDNSAINLFHMQNSFDNLYSIFTPWIAPCDFRSAVYVEKTSD